MYKAHVSEEKKREVQDIISLVKKYKVIGLVDMCGLPALQLMRIKKHLKDMILKFTKKSLIRIAFDGLKEEKKNLESLKEKLTGMPALIFTDMDPFELSKLIKRNLSNAPAKSGQIAPSDMIIPAGPTNFMAGPMIGELGALRIKTKVENGKISIISDKLLVKKGDIINDKQADLLGKFGIEPMKVGLNLVYTYENGEILSKDILFVDEELYINNLKMASYEGIALALEIEYIVKDTAELLIAKVYREAKNLRDKVKIEEPKLVGEKKVEVKQEVIQEIKKEEPIEEKQIIEEPKEKIVQEIKQKPIILEKKEHKETQLEKEMREQKEIVEEKAQKDEEDNVVIETKSNGFETMANKAKNILDNLVTEKLAKQGKPIKKSDLREKKEIDDVNKFINELKDKKAKGEL